MADLLSRLHLFELEDQSWVPSSWRNFMTDYLRHVEGQFGLFRHALAPLKRALDDSRAERIIDLCSGGGGPLAEILNQWQSEGRVVTAVLTDLYPNAEAFAAAQRQTGGRISFYATPVDARTVPSDLAGLRTIFNGFHHFRPEQARAVLADAVGARAPIAVFEVADRTLTAILPLLFVPLFVWLITPFIRPFRWSRLLWTYVIPILPFAVLWDGMVSYLRAYTPDELLAMGRAVEAKEYCWEAGYHSADNTPGRMTYLIGVPPL